MGLFRRKKKNDVDDSSIKDILQKFDHVIEFTEQKYEDTLQQCRPKYTQIDGVDKVIKAELEPEKMSPEERFEIERLVHALVGKGKALYSLDRVKEARECIEKASWYDPNNRLSDHYKPSEYRKTTKSDLDHLNKKEITKEQVEKEFSRE